MNEIEYKEKIVSKYKFKNKMNKLIKKLCENEVFMLSNGFFS